MDGFLKQVADLSATEHIEIFNILKHCPTTRYMQNANGTFVDMASIPQDVMGSITRFVEYCHQNKGMMDDYNNRLAECRLNQDFDRLPKYEAIVNLPMRSNSDTHIDAIKESNKNGRKGGGDDDVEDDSEDVVDSKDDSTVAVS